MLGGRFHIYIYTDLYPMREPEKADRLTYVHELEKFCLENLLMNCSASDPSFQRTAFGSR